MKPIKNLLLLFVFLCFANCFAQDVPELSNDDWNTIIPHLVKEDWKQAAKLSGDYLARYKGEAELSDDAAILRYMYLKCIGGMVGSKMITKEEGLAKLNGFKGKNIITPYIVFRAKGMFNFLKLSEEGTAWFRTSANDTATEIHMFETYNMKDPSMLTGTEKYEGHKFRLFATIQDITASGSALPRLNITYADTELWDVD